VSHIKVQGEFGCAYVRAVAHAAGYVVDTAGRWADEDGVDLTIHALTGTGRTRSPRLEVQVKTTTLALVGDPFPIDLGVKNYHELRSVGPYETPRLLVVVSVPEQRSDWLTATPEQLVLRHTAYFHSLRGYPDTPNTDKIRVHLQRASVFHPDRLQAIMVGVEQGNPP
jgi:hypothetical protein